MSLLGAILGVGGSLLGIKSAKQQAQATTDAAQLGYDATMTLAKPLLDAQRKALPRLDAVSNVLGSQMGKDSTILKAAHEDNSGRIARNKGMMLGSSKRFWNASGNTGRGRGEALRISESATDAANSENLNYAGAQESYRDNKMSQYIGSLDRLATLGATGSGIAINGINTRTAGAMNAAGIRASGTMGLAEDMGSIGGMMIGDYLGDRENKRMLKLLGKG